MPANQYHISHSWHKYPNPSVMKKSFIHPCIIVSIVTFLNFPRDFILAQEQVHSQETQESGWIFNLPRRGPVSVLMDTVRPTLGNCGKGLLHYDCILLKDQDMIYVYTYRQDQNTVMLKAAVTEFDLEILRHNKLLIDEQYHIQVREWIRKDRLDLNLGEAIKGFYMQPHF